MGSSFLHSLHSATQKERVESLNRCSLEKRSKSYKSRNQAQAIRIESSPSQSLGALEVPASSGRPAKGGPEVAGSLGKAWDLFLVLGDQQK